MMKLPLWFGRRVPSLVEERHVDVGCPQSDDKPENDSPVCHVRLLSVASAPATWHLVLLVVAVAFALLLLGSGASRLPVRPLGLMTFCHQDLLTCGCFRYGALLPACGSSAFASIRLPVCGRFGA